MKPRSSTNLQWRREGLLLLPGLRLLAVLAAVVIVGLWWGMARGSRATLTKEPVKAATPPRPANDVLVIPVTDEAGRAAEPLVLVPVNSTPTPRVIPTNATAPIRVAAPAARTNPPPFGLPDIPNFEEKVLAAQVGLARQAISSGSFDGVMGLQTRTALRAFQRREGLPLSGTLDEATRARLQSDTPLFTNWVVAAEDLARLLPLGTTWLAKSEQERLDYETILELVAERTQSNPKLVRALNPGVDWSRVAAGTRLKVVAIAYPEPERKAVFVRISIGGRTLQAFDAETNLLAHFPCSIAARVEKRPVGEELHVNVVAPNPNYTFDPDVFPESAEARQLGRKLILQPGPNNPVGAVWIGLDKPGYGMHGTPKPEDVGRTESHGCFRLANWNAEHLLKLVTVGTPVFVEP